MFWKKKPPEKAPDKVEQCASEMWNTSSPSEQHRILEKYLPELVDVNLMKHPSFCNQWLFEHARRCIKEFRGLNNVAYWPGKLYESEHVTRRTEDAIYLWYLFQDLEALKEFYWESESADRCVIVRDALQFYPSAFQKKNDQGISLENLVLCDDYMEPFQAAFNILMGAYEEGHPAINSATDHLTARSMLEVWAGRSADQVLVNYLDCVRIELIRHYNASCSGESVVDYCIEHHLDRNPLLDVFPNNYDARKATKLFYGLIKLHPLDETVKLVLHWAGKDADIILAGIAMYAMYDVNKGETLEELAESPFYTDRRHERKAGAQPLEIAAYFAGFLIGAYVEYCQATQDRKNGFTVFHILDLSPFLSRVFAAIIAIGDTCHPTTKDAYITDVFNGFVEYLEDDTDDEDVMSIESRLFLNFVGFDLKYDYARLSAAVSLDDDELYRNMIHWFFGWILENRDMIENLLPESFKK